MDGNWNDILRAVHAAQVMTQRALTFGNGQRLEYYQHCIYRCEACSTVIVLTGLEADDDHAYWHSAQIRVGICGPAEKLVVEVDNNLDS